MKIDDFFSNRLVELSYDETLKAYIVSVCKQFMYTDNCRIGESITVMFFDAVRKNEFSSFQCVGDWAFWTAVFREKVFHEHSVVYERIARSSYDTCYRLLRKQWPIFEQLADEFSEITSETRQKIIVTRPGFMIN